MRTSSVLALLTVSAILGLLITGCRVETTESNADVLDTSPDNRDSASDQVPAECDAGALCDGSTGLCAPVARCTPDNPCTDAFVGVSPVTINQPMDSPDCVEGGYDDGPPVTWVDEETGWTRSGCVYRPPGASSESPRPLVVFLHGSGGSANSLYMNTSLRAKADGYDFYGDGQRPGFIVASHNGSNQRIDNGQPAASRHEVFYRDFGNPARNHDARALDRFIDELVANGDVDPERIYLIGWSNGAFFGQAYAIHRWNTPTAAGNRIAAVVAYDGGDPFQRPLEELQDCDLTQVPQADLPIMLIHRACSIVGCDAQQRADQGLPPGYDVNTWAERLRTEVGASQVENVILNGFDEVVQECTGPLLCTNAGALLNHAIWPDGRETGSYPDYEPMMLDFLARHRLTE